MVNSRRVTVQSAGDAVTSVRGFSRFGTARRGAAATELALTLPLLLLIAFGCVDFGRGIGIYIAVSNAARVGAEYGATHQFTTHTRDSWEQQIRQSVEDEMEQVTDYQASNLTVDVEVAGSDDDVRVTVAVSYPFEPVSSWPGVASDLTFARQVSMRQFR